MRSQWWVFVAGVGVALAAARLPAALAQAAQQPPSGPARPAPESIWPATLEKIAGRYVFVQVGSPGGFWEWRIGGNAPREPRQICINDVPAALREQLTAAELVISDLKLPTHKEASERRSPSGRGLLRFYSEHAEGRLAMKGLPGIGGEGGDKGTYTGRVQFALEHQSHSNPSVSGILFRRLQEEVTWGAATLDYADLEAIPIDPPGPDPDDPLPAIANARVLRGGIEIFAYIEYFHQDGDVERVIRGTARLMKAGQPFPPPMPRRDAD